MKKQFFFSMLAAAMLVGCSSEEVLTEKGNFNYDFAEGQPAYIAVGLAMPGDAGTRANDDFHDGDATEYEVKSGRLVIFKGATEATAKLVQQIDITEGLTFALDGTSNQITSTSQKFVAEIKDPSLGVNDKLYAYVILNDKDNATNLDYTAGTPFTVFSQKVLKAIGIKNETTGFGGLGDNGLVMTSVPLSTTAGGTQAATGTPFTLTPIEASAVYKTAEEAKAGDQVACCYVERAAVKVEVKVNEITDPADKTLKIGEVTWALGNVNNDASGYYNTRQFDAAWMPLNNALAPKTTTKHRFVCEYPLFATEHMKGYRTYFGSDVNYDGNKGLVNSQVTEYPLANNGVTYTYENTFDENNQKFMNTTFVGLRIVLNGGKTFYTVKSDDNTALDEENLKNALINNVDAQIGVTYVKELIAKIETALKATLADDATATFKLGYEVALGAKNEFNQLTYTVTLKVTDPDGTTEAAIKALTVDGKKVEDILAENLAAREDVTPEVATEYTNGVTYYATRIAHFGDAETPCSTTTAAYNEYDMIYPTNGVSLDGKTYGTDRANAWLGRWGIVRNNWYSLEITKIEGIGDATPLNYDGKTTGPDGDNPGETPDDNPKPKYYISAHIHITPWVLRTQQVEL
ncbi:MAG: fimbria major subunit [Prevotellaceae bacterium]|nr:fimbria major subunit [Prevotellaceae bacterium]